MDLENNGNVYVCEEKHFTLAYRNPGQCPVCFCPTWFWRKAAS